MDYWISVAVWLTLTAACVHLPGWIAGRRGRSAKLWYWFGAL